MLNFVFSTIIFIALGADNPFHINRLPAGNSITLPRPASTIIPIGKRVRLTATDLPQSIKISLQNPGLTKAKIRLAIYDSLAERVNYIEIQNRPILYTFKNFQEMFMIPQVRQWERHHPAQTLRIDSNKPLTIGR